MRSQKRPRALTAIVLAFGILAFAVAAAGPAVAEKPEKVTICHYPPGNPDNAQTIEVGAPAAVAHIALHDDTVGACGEDDDDDTGGGDED